MKLLGCCWNGLSLPSLLSVFWREGDIFAIQSLSSPGDAAEKEEILLLLPFHNLF